MSLQELWPHSFRLQTEAVKIIAADQFTPLKTISRGFRIRLNTRFELDRCIRQKEFSRFQIEHLHWRLLPKQ